MCSRCGKTKNRLRTYAKGYFDEEYDFYRIYETQGVQYSILATHIKSFGDITKHFHL